MALAASACGDVQPSTSPPASASGVMSGRPEDFATDAPRRAALAHGRALAMALRDSTLRAEVFRRVQLSALPEHKVFWSRDVELVRPEMQRALTRLGHVVPAAQLTVREVGRDLSCIYRYERTGPRGAATLQSLLQCRLVRATQSSRTVLMAVSRH